MGWDEETGELITYFEGPCTCDHEEDEHGWGGCNIEGCDCSASWTE